jgi:hypothetical protein
MVPVQVCASETLCTPQAPLPPAVPPFPRAVPRVFGGAERESCNLASTACFLHYLSSKNRGVALCPDACPPRVGLGPGRGSVICDCTLRVRVFWF